MDATQSNAFRDRRRAPGAHRIRPVLYVLLLAGQPLAPPSRHLLDGVDTIAFSRGPRAARRDGTRLTIAIPDPVMSSDHGRVVATASGWLLEDPRSKNGAVVAGRPTRCAPLRPGDVFELGHTLFQIAEVACDVDTPFDATRDDLAAPTPELTTFVPELARQFDALRRVAASDVPVLLLGESGVGKEVLARAVHGLSGRPGPLVAVNCGALAPHLVEAELFGHRKGAFSGAIADRPGYVRSAHQGTLFLDELGDLPLATQASLLRVLQEREVTPVGDSRPVPVEVRVCAATHRDLATMVADGRFRQDLYARLLGLTIELPPLRDRTADLGVLLGRLLARLPGGTNARFTPAAAAALFRYPWPLNVRELERALATAVALAAPGAIDLAHLPVAVAATLEDEPTGATTAPTEDTDGGEALRRGLVDALARHQGNVAAAARDLGKGREQLHRWARRFGIDLESFRR